MWAAVYMFLGQFQDIGSALYFSTTTFTTLGFGDVVLQERWQLLSGLESANGIILLGVSTGVILTAFLKLVQMVEIIKPDT